MQNHAPLVGRDAGDRRLVDQMLPVRRLGVQFPPQLVVDQVSDQLNLSGTAAHGNEPWRIGTGRGWLKSRARPTGRQSRPSRLYAFSAESGQGRRVAGE